jgi:hypothetical protein
MDINTLSLHSQEVNTFFCACPTGETSHAGLKAGGIFHTFSFKTAPFICYKKHGGSKYG